MREIGARLGLTGRGPRRRDGIEGGCLEVPKATPSCLDPVAVPAGPELLYDQVRNRCADGSEGTAHPF